MGGQNQQKFIKPPGNVFRLNCELAKYVFQLPIDYYGAHIHLEDAVISESRGEPVNTVAIQQAQQGFQTMLANIDSAIQFIDASLSEVQQDGPTWQPDYFTTTRTTFQQFRLDIDVLVQAITAPTIMSEANKGELQESLWNDGVNAQVRLSSLSFIRKFSAFQDYYATSVEETNIVE